MEFLKELFGENSLTFSQFSEALSAHPEIKLANLASGEFVAKGKYDAMETELNTANTTIKTLQDAVKKFDGVDIDKLRGEVDTWKNKYTTDIEALRLSAAVDAALAKVGAKNPKLVKSCIDLTKVKLDGENVLGLSEQLESLKSSDGYLFGDTDSGNSSAGTGMAQGKSGEDLSKLSDEEYYARVYEKK